MTPNGKRASAVRKPTHGGPGDNFGKPLGGKINPTRQAVATVLPFVFPVYGCPFMLHSGLTRLKSSSGPAYGYRVAFTDAFCTVRRRGRRVATVLSTLDKWSRDRCDRL